MINDVISTKIVSPRTFICCARAIRRGIPTTKSITRFCHRPNSTGLTSSATTFTRPARHTWRTGGPICIKRQSIIINFFTWRYTNRTVLIPRISKIRRNSNCNDIWIKVAHNFQWGSIVCITTSRSITPVPSIMPTIWSSPIIINR